MTDNSRRTYCAFVSYSHADQAIVDRLQAWLAETAGLSIWRDKEAMPASSSISRALDEAIENSRAMLVVLSQNSLKSGWAAAERAQAVAENINGLPLPAAQQFRIVPVRIDEAVGPRDVPGFLRDVKWVDLPGGALSLETADQLLTALSAAHADRDPRGSRDVYVARSWKANESAVPDAVCGRLIQSGLRLIGDSTTQQMFDPERIRSIVSSCGGCVAVLPNRGGRNTSRYIPREIAIARELDVPYLILAEGELDVDEELVADALDGRVFQLPVGGVDAGVLEDAVESSCLHWRESSQPHYLFYATGFREENQARRNTVRRLIERVTALPCYMGDDHKNDKEITARILGAQMVIADISAQNVNSCIEAGIALGAGRPLQLITSTARKEAPFMFRTLQQERYSDDATLLGVVHRLVAPHRRRVINGELA